MNISKTYIAHTTGKLLMKIYIKESKCVKSEFQLLNKIKNKGCRKTARAPSIPSEMNQNPPNELKAMVISFLRNIILPLLIPLLLYSI